MKMEGPNARWKEAVEVLLKEASVSKEECSAFWQRLEKRKDKKVRYRSDNVLTGQLCQLLHENSQSALRKAIDQRIGERTNNAPGYWTRINKEVIVTKAGSTQKVTCSLTPASELRVLQDRYAQGPKGICSSTANSREHPTNLWLHTFQVGEEFFPFLRVGALSSFGVELSEREATQKKKAEELALSLFEAHKARDAIFSKDTTHVEICAFSKKMETIPLPGVSFLLITASQLTESLDKFQQSRRGSEYKQMEAHKEAIDFINQTLCIKTVKEDGTEQYYRPHIRLFVFPSNQLAQYFNRGWECSNEQNVPEFEELFGHALTHSKNIKKDLVNFEDKIGGDLRLFLSNTVLEPRRRQMILFLSKVIMSMWYYRSYKSCLKDGEPYKMPIFLNALFALMYEVPIISCKSAKDRTAMMIAWSAYFNTQVVQILEEDTPISVQPAEIDFSWIAYLKKLFFEWFYWLIGRSFNTSENRCSELLPGSLKKNEENKENLKAFLRDSGNFEIQEINTGGFRGYKNMLSVIEALLGKAFYEEMTGLSRFAKG